MHKTPMRAAFETAMRNTVAELSDGLETKDVSSLVVNVALSLRKDMGVYRSRRKRSRK